MLIENDETNDDDIETKEVNEVNVNTAMKSLEKRLNYEGSLLLVSNHYDNQETYIRTCFHFFLQYCILNPSLVIVLTDIYAIAALQKQKEINNIINNNINNNIDNNNNAMEINETTTTITTTSTTITNTIPIKSKWDVIKSILESSLRDILPALIKRHKMDSNRIENEILSAIMNYDILSRPLLDQVLLVLNRDETLPASSTMIIKVKEYLLEIVDTSKSDEEKALDDIRTLIPLLGGMQSQEILTLLPTIMKSFVNDLDTLKLAFCRIVQARPPALSRKELLSYLHRMDDNIGNNIIIISFYYMNNNLNTSSSSSSSSSYIYRIRSKTTYSLY